jgi:serine protease inhibitor
MTDATDMVDVTDMADSGISITPELQLTALLLLKILSKDKSQIVSIAPMSIKLALMIVCHGADGSTRDELLGLLGATSEVDFDHYLEGVEAMRVLLGDSMAIGNSVWRKALSFDVVIS